MANFIKQRSSESNTHYPDISQDVCLIETIKGMHFLWFKRFLLPFITFLIADSSFFLNQKTIRNRKRLFFNKNLFTRL